MSDETQRSVASCPSKRVGYCVRIVTGITVPTERNFWQTRTKNGSIAYRSNTGFPDEFLCSFRYLFIIRVRRYAPHIAFASDTRTRRCFASVKQTCIAARPYNTYIIYTPIRARVLYSTGARRRGGSSATIIVRLPNQFGVRRVPRGRIAELQYRVASDYVSYTE